MSRKGISGQITMQKKTSRRKLLNCYSGERKTKANLVTLNGDVVAEEKEVC